MVGLFPTPTRARARARARAQSVDQLNFSDRLYFAGSGSTD
jgi:hypothetical protein